MLKPMILTASDPTQPAAYQAYLVRMWRSSPDTVWRASAQHTQSGEIVFFADLERLFRFLYTQSVDPSQTAEVAAAAASVLF
jgi:hypothetical protein